MYVESVIVTGDTIYLPNPLPTGSKVAITDISYALDRRLELYNLNITAYSPDSKMKKQVFNFMLPIEGYSFDSFKTKLLNECKLIHPQARRFIAYRFIKRITMNSNKLVIKKDRGKRGGFKLAASPKFTFFEIEMSATLAAALGSPAKNIRVTPQGRLVLSHFLQDCTSQTPFTFIHFRPKKTVSIKCQEVDLRKHLDNVLLSFNLKMYTRFRSYTQKRHVFFSELSPTVHHRLTFCWDSVVKVHHMTVLILRP
jgi:hypothetical protein